MNEMNALEEHEMLEDITTRLDDYGRERGALIPILQMIQERHAYLSPQALRVAAEHLNIPLCEVYGVASFYNQFRFHPPGRHQIKVCLGTACHVRAGDVILENFERKLEILAGETTADRQFSIDRVACVGCCALAPVAILDETVHGQMSPSKVEGMLLRFQIEKEVEEKEKQKRERGG
jgi:NADH-quinone oxidoreductase subunit E